MLASLAQRSTVPALYYVMLRSHHGILSDRVASAEEEAAGFPTTGHVHFLFDGYEPPYYWFEVLDCVRRLLLAAIIGVVSFTATAAPVAGFAISIGFTWVFTYLKPFTDNTDNTLSITLSYVTVFFFYAALLVKVNATSDDEDDQAVFGALLLFFIFSGPLVMVFLTLRDFLRAGKCFVESTEESGDVELTEESSDVESTEPSSSGRGESIDRLPPLTSTVGGRGAFPVVAKGGSRSETPRRSSVGTSLDGLNSSRQGSTNMQARSASTSRSRSETPARLPRSKLVGAGVDDEQGHGRRSTTADL